MIRTRDIVFEIYSKPQRVHAGLIIGWGMFFGWRDESGAPSGVVYCTDSDLTGLAGEWIA